MHDTNNRAKCWRDAHLYCPEITWQKQNDGDHIGDETSDEKLTKEVDEDGACAEEEMKEAGLRVSEKNKLLFIYYV